MKEIEKKGSLPDTIGAICVKVTFKVALEGPVMKRARADKETEDQGSLKSLKQIELPRGRRLGCTTASHSSSTVSLTGPFPACSSPTHSFPSSNKNSPRGQPNWKPGNAKASPQLKASPRARDLAGGPLMMFLWSSPPPPTHPHYSRYLNRQRNSPLSTWKLSAHLCQRLSLP